MECLRERKLPVDFNQYWAEVLKRNDGTYSERLQDDGTEQEFWKKFMAKKNGYRQDENAAVIMKEIKKILDAYSLDRILEIGPGWGNYTMDLARLCKELICVDISQDVLSFIREAAKEQGLCNMNTIRGKWEEVALPNTYDLVFGYNCFYRMLDLQAAFTKMNQYANKLCMVGMGMGVCPPYCHELENLVEAKPVYEKKDYIYFINILYSMGIDPNVKIIPLSKKKQGRSLKEAALQEVRDLFGNLDGVEIRLEEIQKVLSRYWRETDSGKWEYDYQFRGALVYWNPVRDLESTEQ